MQPNQYVEKRGEGWYIAGTRVSLDSIIYCVRNGESPQSIANDCFPVITEEEAAGAVAFYAAHREELDRYVEEGERKGDEWAAKQDGLNPALAEKLAKLRRERVLRVG